MLLKIFILFSVFTLTIFPQQCRFLFSFGEFNSAASFFINPSGFIYVTDSGTEEIYKLDTTGIRLKDIGGYGWNEAAFDEPADIFATPLNVYVADKNNHRIQRFDKDLNFISELSTRENENEEEQFGYPLSVATSNQGDLYILDSENKRIIKFDLFGNFIENFGGYDAGAYSLNNPKKLSISSQGNIYVIDGTDLIVYDQYGNGLALFETENELKSLNIIFDKMTLTTENNILFTDLNSADKLLKEIFIFDEDKREEVLSSMMFNNKLYLLTENEILVYEPVSSF